MNSHCIRFFILYSLPLTQRMSKYKGKEFNGFDALSLAKEVKRKYSIDTYFIYEDIFTGAENVDSEISFYGMIQDYLDRQKKQKKKLKKIFAELTENED